MINSTGQAIEFSTYLESSSSSDLWAVTVQTDDAIITTGQALAGRYPQVDAQTFSVGNAVDPVISVIRMNSAPVISSAATQSVNENQLLAIDVQSTDDCDSEGAGLSYALSGDVDDALFNIDVDTGEVTFIGAPDFENPFDEGADNVYNIEITVTDSGALAVIQDVAILVVNVNESPQIISVAMVTLLENLTVVADIQSTDDSDTEGSGLQYSITGGADAALFDVNGESGVLSFKLAPDYETPADADTNNSYAVQVSVTDSGDLTDVQDLVIQVTDESENIAPQITSAASAVVPENLTLAIDIQSTDDNDTEGSGLLYSITGGADAALFDVNGESGVLSFKLAPDYETPADADTNNSYAVQVSVTDSGDLTDVQDLVIQVTDESENIAPQITSAASAVVPENLTLAIDIQSTDDSDTEGSGLLYSITGGADAALFDVNGESGVLSFKLAPDYETPADADTNNSYAVQVSVTDSGDLTDVQDLVIQVTDESENIAPQITSAASAVVSENLTLAIDIQSTDDSDTEGSGLLYSITGGADAALFDVNGESGVLSFKLAPDYETPADADTNNSYAVQVSVTDSGDLTDVQDLVIQVTDESENIAPQITSAASAVVPENLTLAIDIQSTDDNDTEGSGLLYSITGGADAALFDVNGESGVLSFKLAPDYETPADADTNNSYAVQVSVTDSGDLTDVQDLVIQVTDESENIAPVISASAQYSVRENTILVANIEATDDSDTEGDGLSYQLSGTDSGAFAIDAQSGELSFTLVPDFEIPTDSGGDNIYNLTITVTDSGDASDSIEIAISVTDIGDENDRPRFIGPRTFIVGEGQQFAGDVNASDNNDSENDGLIYSIGGGVDSEHFSLNQDGFLSFITIPDFENPHDQGGNNRYSLYLQVMDSDGYTTRRIFAVIVRNLPDNNKPRFRNLGSSITTPENQRFIRDIDARDDNDTEGVGLRYSIESGYDSDLFEIDGDTGVLSFVTTPDYENPWSSTDVPANRYSVVIRVADSQGLYTTKLIAIRVVDRPDNSAPRLTALTSRMNENDTFIGTAKVRDDNDSVGAGLVFALVGAEDDNFFDIYQDGSLYFKHAPDYETPLDADANNRYWLTIQLSDSEGLSAVFRKSVTVSNVKNDELWCFGRKPTILGTLGDDVITGTGRADVIMTFGGNDEIVGLSGNDRICSGSGNDTIHGGNGGDYIDAGEGNDIVYGGTGSDVIYGRLGNDEIYGESGSNRLFGNDGDDVIYIGERGTVLGGIGEDELIAQAVTRRSSMYGGPGNDILVGGPFRDSLHGDDGDDVLDGMGANDRCDGSSGVDVSENCEVLIAIP